MSTPRLVYDDDCGFCTRSAHFIARHSGLEPVGFSALTEADRERLPPNYERCAHLITDERVYSCGEAMEEAFMRTDLAYPPLHRAARRVPGYTLVRDSVYRWIAANRDLVGRVL